MFTDSHCHLDRVNLTPYANDFSRMLEENLAAGVAQILCVSIDLASYHTIHNLVANYSQVSVSVGIHPNEAEGLDVNADTLVQLAQDLKVVAIGETGLDYYRPSKSGDAREIFLKQQQSFRTHIQAAKTCNKPLIIHSRQAPQDSLRILQEEHADSVGGVFHCFTEDWDTAKKALDLGFYISFSGIITFANAKSLREVAKQIPLNRLLIETDSPYLAPVPHRGKSNEPKFVAYVAQCIAELRNMSTTALAEATQENFIRLFQSA